MSAITQTEIDQQVFSLYDEYCHGRIDRREFLKRAGAIGALGFAISLLPDYARAQTISFTDTRIKAQYVTYPSPGGNAASMRGYLVHPAGQGPFPAVLVVHENRGLNPYIEDVARRAAVEGFIALAPDGLAPLGGYPGNDDDGRDMQAKLDQAKLRTDMLNGAKFLKAHKLSTGKLGATGFCWGGGTTNWLATALGASREASVIGGEQLSLAGATLLNGYLITAVTVCDVHRPTLCHTTPQVVPPALAIAERNGASISPKPIPASTRRIRPMSRS